jgi:hypothetical protein
MIERNLFDKGLLNDTLNTQNTRVNIEVNKIPKEQFLSNNEETLLEHVFAELSIEPIILYEESKVMETKETKMQVNSHISGTVSIPAVEIVVIIPFSGDPELWKLMPSKYKPLYPDTTNFKVRSPGKDGIGFIDIMMTRRNESDPQEVKQSLEKQLVSIRLNISNQTEQLEEFNKTLRGKIQKAIRERRDRLKAQDGLASFLDIPLKKREGTPEILPIAVKRKLLRPLAQQKGYKPEPGISDEDYDHILNVIRNEGRTFEATPKTYAVHNEEELRDILLAHLNGHYEGNATGETFRKTGKTDIRIEDDNRAAFVAECKIWRGAKEIDEAVYQLLSYLTWRDCKAAVIVFNKNIAGFTEILSKFPETMKQHSCFVREISKPGNGEWRFSFHSNEDNARMIIIHAFLFNLYVKS